MSVYRFNVAWTHLLEVEASSEEEAWEYAHDEALHAFSKSKGDLHIDLDEGNDSSDEDEWGLFDKDPEDEDITFIALDENNNW